MGIVASEDAEDNIIDASAAFNGTSAYHYYHGNERMDVEYITDEAGQVVNGYTYDAFGTIVTASEKLQNRYTYNGEAFDKTTEQYYLRKRFYNSKLSRFIQEDEYRGDGLNLYAFCANNPVMYVDPSGYASQRELAKTVPGLSYDQKKQKLYERYSEFINDKINRGKINISYDGLLENELMVKSYSEMPQEKGDYQTPHHMPAAESIQADGIAYNDGVCLNVREDTHRLTFTYGMGDSDSRAYDYALYNSLSYEDRLDFDQMNIREAYALQRPNVDPEMVNEALRIEKEQALKTKKEQETKKKDKCKG